MDENQEVDTKDIPPEEPVINEQEQIARAQGWKPQEEAPDLVEAGKWVNFDEFNRRKEFFDAIHKVNQKNKRLEEQLDVLAKHHAQTKENALKQAREELLQERRAAAKENDIERVVEIDEKLEELPTTTTQTATNTVPPEAFQEFVERNSWYRDDVDLQVYANGYGAKLEKENPNIPMAELFSRVEAKVRETFPTKFQTAGTTQRVSSVSPSRPGPDGPGAVKKKRITYNDLPDDAKDMHNKLVKSARNPYGKLTSEQYLKDYAANSGLPYEE